MRTLRTISYSLVFLTTLSNTLSSQEIEPNKSKESLHKEIVKMDSLLFQVAFNKCKLKVWEKIMAKEFEFYDDRTGLNTSRQVEVNSFKDRCSKSYKVTRKLVSTAVDVLGEYGAVQTGEHVFYVDDKKVEKAKFIITRLTAYSIKGCP